LPGKCNIFSIRRKAWEKFVAFIVGKLASYASRFLDENLKTASKISFHPNINTYSVIIAFKDFIRYLDWTGNSYEFLQLYD
jgi:hypothetical protein